MRVKTPSQMSIKKNRNRAVARFRFFVANAKKGTGTVLY